MPGELERRAMEHAKTACKDQSDPVALFAKRDFMAGMMAGLELAEEACLLRNYNFRAYEGPADKVRESYDCAKAIRALLDAKEGKA